MPNKYTITINPETELGEAIDNIINQLGFGSATFLIKLFMEKYREQLIKFWNGQGKNGEEIYNKYFEKWSKTKDEQAKIREQKKIEAKKKIYLKLGFSEEDAEFFAGLPNEEVELAIKLKNNLKQTAPKDEFEEFHQYKAIVNMQDFPDCRKIYVKNEYANLFKQKFPQATEITHGTGVTTFQLPKEMKLESQSNQ